MNKDVIYIEPEQDITDIIANIKAAKNKIVALVPPKKAGVLRSAVNFKLIAKAARQSGKTVVLVTTDESLRRLASTVAMPIAKSLQSKPQLPEMDDAEEFGDEAAESDTIEDEGTEEEQPADELAEVGPEAEEGKPVVAAATKKPAVKEKAAPKEEVIEGEPEPEAKEPKTKAEAKTAKNVDKMKKAKIPNFAKYRKFIILGAVVLVLLIGFTVWATAIAPAAKITVVVRAAAANFTEKVTFVDNEDKSDPKKGILYIEQKSITKKAEAEFEVKTEVDKGEKASGTIQVTRPQGDPLDDKNDLTFSIPANTTVTIGGKTYVVAEGGSANASEDRVDRKECGTFWAPKTCYSLKETIYSGNIKIVAKEAGEDYNIPNKTSDVKLNLNTDKHYSVSMTSEISGGSSKKVKVVGKEDVETATSELSDAGEEEAREELTSQFSSEYILLGSMTASDPKITTSPELNQEVKDNVTPKIVREVKYTVYAVNREAVNTFIKTKLEEGLTGDKTQQIYDTGIDGAFFESFQNAKDDRSAKLKTTTKTGPRVTDEIVAEMALGRKVGEVQSRLRSTKGVAEVKIDTSYFWVTSIPDDINKVQIEITVE